MMRRERKGSVSKLALLGCVDCVSADTSFDIGYASNFSLAKNKIELALMSNNKVAEVLFQDVFLSHSSMESRD